MTLTPRSDVSTSRALAKAEMMAPETTGTARPRCSTGPVLGADRTASERAMIEFLTAEAVAAPSAMTRWERADSTALAMVARNEGSARSESSPATRQRKLGAVREARARAMMLSRSSPLRDTSRRTSLRGPM